jgi:preprotein translocase subunit YajC
MTALIPILVLVVLMYFMLIRPQQRRARAQQALMAAIQEGDEVMTTAGIYGFVTAMEGDIAWVEIAEGVEIRVAKAALARRIDSETAGTAAPETEHATDAPEASGNSANGSVAHDDPATQDDGATHDEG